MELKYAKDTSKTNDDIEYKFGVWYPIESAPKDGSSILAIIKGYIPAIVKWEDFDKIKIFNGVGSRWVEDTEGIFEDDIKYREWLISSQYNPTHWMPLPPNP